jgi:hypothetical protein
MIRGCVRWINAFGGILESNLMYLVRNIFLSALYLCIHNILCKSMLYQCNVRT